MMSELRIFVVQMKHKGRARKPPDDPHHSSRCIGCGCEISEYGSCEFYKGFNGISVPSHGHVCSEECLVIAKARFVGWAPDVLR